MSSTESLAQQIAQLIEANIADSKHASVFAALEKINHRLDKLEKAASQPQAEIRNPQLIHPSLDKFSIAEAIADAVIDAKTKEKACTFEPNGKPCDHCSMCSSRGF